MKTNHKANKKSIKVRSFLNKWDEAFNWFVTANKLLHFQGLSRSNTLNEIDSRQWSKAMSLLVCPTPHCLADSYEFNHTFIFTKNWQWFCHTYLGLHNSGPSQEFDWVGHGYTGNSVPLTIPNIFKAAGIDTKWDPVTNKVFETGNWF